MTAWVRLVRCALLRATIQSMGYNIPPSFLAQMVITGNWTADRALGLVALIARPELQAEHYRLLLEKVELTDVQRDKAAAGLEAASVPRQSGGYIVRSG